MTHLLAMATEVSDQLAAGWRATPGVGLEKGRWGQEGHTERQKNRLKVIARIQRRDTMSLPRWKRVHGNNRRKVADASAWTSKEKDCIKLRMDPVARIGVLWCVQRRQAHLNRGHRRRNNHQIPTGPDPWRGGGALLGACEVKKKKWSKRARGRRQRWLLQNCDALNNNKSEQPSTNCSKHEPVAENCKSEGGINCCRMRWTRVPQSMEAETSEQPSTNRKLAAGAEQSKADETGWVGDSDQGWVRVDLSQTWPDLLN
jgi:hypothetical protein